MKTMHNRYGGNVGHHETAIHQQHRDTDEQHEDAIHEAGEQQDHITTS